jgi:hypothetical protein
MPSRSRFAAVLVVFSLLASGCAAGPAPTTAPPASRAAISPSPSASSPSPRPTTSATPSASPTPPPPPPLTGVADLTGEAVADPLAHRLPIAVLIDDNRVARPQSGFNGASLVYQAPADGGETRYMFVYQQGDSSEIGPVRSGRIYFVHWASELHAAIGHYGGDNLSRWYLKKYDHDRFTSVDALGKGAKAFHRVKFRSAPHNGYTSTKKLRSVALKLKAPATMDPTLFRRPFVDESRPERRAASQWIKVPYGTGLVGYVYDAERNVYARLLDGKRQVDPADRRNVTTRNVVVLFQSFKIDTKIEPGHARPVVGSIGEGKAWVFREGRLVKGTWRKASETEPTRLFDATGTEIPLVRGRTYFQIVPTTAKVTTGS